MLSSIHKKEVKEWADSKNRRDRQQAKLMLATAVIGLATATIKLIRALVEWLER